MNNKSEKTDVIVRCASDRLLPLILVYVMYIILHGHLSPGGGFQGGVLVAAAVVFLYLGHGYECTVKTLSYHGLHTTEGFASIFYVALGLLGVAVGAQFAQNVLYTHGAVGDLYSSGTIFWMNVTVGVKVFTGVGSIALLMLGVLNRQPDEKEVN